MPASHNNNYAKSGAPLCNENIHDQYIHSTHRPTIAYDEFSTGTDVDKRIGQIHHGKTNNHCLFNPANIPIKTSAEDKIVADIIDSADNGALSTNEIKNYAREQCREVEANEHYVLDRLEKAINTAH